jgi:hypothetical protein
MPAYLLCENDGLEPSRIVLEHPGDARSVEGYCLMHSIGGPGRVFTIHPLPLNRSKMSPDKARETFILCSGSKGIEAPAQEANKDEVDLSAFQEKDEGDDFSEAMFP